MEQEEEGDKSARYKEDGPPKHSRSLVTSTAAPSLPKKEPHSDRVVKSASDSDSDSDCRLFQATGTGLSITSLVQELSLASGSDPFPPRSTPTEKKSQGKTCDSTNRIAERRDTLRSERDERSQQAQPNVDDLTGPSFEKSNDPCEPEELQAEGVAENDSTSDSESNGTQQTQPDFDEMEGIPFEKSDEIPDELAESIWRVEGVSCFGIGVLCKQPPLVVYCNPTVKNNAEKDFKMIYDKFKRFMVIIWQYFLVRGTSDPKFSGKDKLGLASRNLTDDPPYISAIGLPVIVNGRNALLGTFHCLVGMLLHPLPAIIELTGADSDTQCTNMRLAPLKKSMEKTGVGLKKYLEKLKSDVIKQQQQHQDTVNLGASTIAPSSTHVKELEFLELLLGARVLDLSWDKLKVHIEFPLKTPFQAYSTSNGGYQRDVGILPIGGVPDRDPQSYTSIGEVAIYFTRNKTDPIADVSHPESLKNSSEIVHENEKLEPQTSIVWKRGPITGETSGKIVYTNVQYALESDHMTPIPLRGAVLVKHFVESDYFSEEGESSSVVYLLKDGEQPKLLGAICAGAFGRVKGEWIWTYDDGREDGDIIRTNKIGALVRTKGVSFVQPFHSQFKVVKDYLDCDIKLPR